MGHGIHQMDLMLTPAGEWTEVRASTGTLARDVETEGMPVTPAMLTPDNPYYRSMSGGSALPDRPQTGEESLRV